MTRENQEVSEPFEQEAIHPGALDTIICDITCYKGKVGKPEWTDLEPGLCPHHTFTTLHLTHPHDHNRWKCDVELHRPV